MNQTWNLEKKKKEITSLKENLRETFSKIFVQYLHDGVYSIMVPVSQFLVTRYKNETKHFFDLYSVPLLQNDIT